MTDERVDPRAYRIAPNYVGLFTDAHVISVLTAITDTEFYCVDVIDKPSDVLHVPTSIGDTLCGLCKE